MSHNLTLTLRGHPIQIFQTTTAATRAAMQNNYLNAKEIYFKSVDEMIDLSDPDEVYQNEQILEHKEAIERAISDGAEWGST